ncbi:MAG: hypothetical protein PHV54_00955 [Tolumonas sp.]|nr:hypothetical protein [Tolumonas sp.]
MEQQYEQQILMIKGVIYGLPKSQQEKIEQLNSKYRELYESDADKGVALMAVTLFYAELMKSIE